MNMWHDVDKRIGRALNGIRQIFRGKLKTVKSDGPVQLVQADALEGENLPDVELFQHYGFTSNPPPESMAVVVPLGGRTSHGIVIATEHGDYRLKSLESGEVAIYTDEEAKIVLKRGRIIDVDCDEYRIKTKKYSLKCETSDVECDSSNLKCSTTTTDCEQFTTSASAGAQFNTPTLTGSQQIQAMGMMSAGGGLSVSGGDGAEIVGDVRQRDGSYYTTNKVVAQQDVLAKEISLHDHIHDDWEGKETDKPKK